MLHILENDHVKIAVNTKGAELQDLILKDSGLNYLWHGDAQFWGKRSPVLFPIVGGLKNNCYQYNGATYHLPRHGFARDFQFQLALATHNSIVFELTHSPETLAVYPFQFVFQIVYTLEQNTLSVTYRVQNPNADTAIWYSVGAHPAFNVPIVANASFSDYYLAFNCVENVSIYPLTADGLLLTSAIPYLQNTNTLPLSKELFYKDALVFKNLQSTAIAIRSQSHSQAITVTFNGFPYMGIWSAPNAPFVCIEPWLGIADSENSNGDITAKEGIQWLQPLATNEHTWQVTIQ